MGARGHGPRVQARGRNGRDGEEVGNKGGPILKWLLPLPLLLIDGFLFLTQQDAVSNVIGLAIAIASLVPTFVNFYQQFQQASAAAARDSRD